MLRIADHIADAHPIKQGSDVYKAARNDERISAVQVFAFTTTAEEDEFFTRQANLLAEMVRQHQANVPAVLSWGFTQNGHFPYIESEWIEGYDLKAIAESDKHISVNDLGILAEQVAKVLTLCHHAEVVHGDIREKHIHWDENKGRFLLTNFTFGLLAEGRGPYTPAATASEQDRVSLKQKDIQDVGRALLRLLERHLLPKGGEGSNDLRGSLADTPLGDGNTMPAWLITCIDSAMSRNEERFKSAHEMYNYIILHHKTPFETNRWFRSKPQKPLTLPPNGVAKTRSGSRQKLQSVVHSGMQTGRRNMRFAFDRRIALGLLVAAILVGFSIIAQNRHNGKASLAQAETSAITQQSDTGASTQGEMNDGRRQQQGIEQKKRVVKKKEPAQKQVAGEAVAPAANSEQQEVGDTGLGAYKVRGKAYFHNAPNERTRRKGFITHWNNAVLHPLKDQNEFVYVEYTNDEGRISRGWLRKRDLIKQ